ncbi:glycerate kinase [Alkalicoccus halolimnae]|uniref:Glycerate kinase n=1 Tax=Alkalicoccus halolimnae TaxID=1667239 RepID=A0A5C7F886_9BACI|nr:glycerate kinase [Alkalicoccus halolimnae]TXF85588.1 glycerate kinase [Alkalicoccus halolimnae]
MKIVIAPGAFTKYILAASAAEAMKKGVHNALPESEIIVLPMADGGIGSSEALLYHQNFTWRTISIHDPQKQKKTFSYCITEDHKAYIDAESVLEEAPETAHSRPLLDSSSSGLGEVISDASDYTDEIIISLGHSSAADMGFGMLEVLGAEFFNETGDRITGLSTKDISSVEKVKIDNLHSPPITVLTKTSGPLTGSEGAAAMTGMQTGETSSVIEFLERAMDRTAGLFPDGTELKKSLGAGASGGTGFAFLTMGASLHSAAAYSASQHNLEEHLQEADLVLTGERRTEFAQDLTGFVTKTAEAAGIEVVVLTSPEEKAFFSAGSTAEEPGAEPYLLQKIEETAGLAVKSRLD